MAGLQRKKYLAYVRLQISELSLKASYIILHDCGFTGYVILRCSVNLIDHATAVVVVNVLVVI